ncbi:MAG: glutamyl-tRNA reductase [Acidobacteria bacterium]|nr:glutamyl-tRNA reductase [Acidobacteriota bacterium]
MSTLVVGLNHLTAPIELRERVTFSVETNREAITRLSAEGTLREAVIVSTCNRSEIYGVGDGEEHTLSAVRNFVCDFHGLDPRQVDGCFYHHADSAAVRHLFRVASSLDSMVLGEPHILGQVRDAFLLALESRTTGLILNQLFQKAGHVGKRVRAETEIGLRPVSVSSVAVDLASKIFGRLGQCSVLVVGAGEMSELTLESLIKRGVRQVTITNRSFDRAQALAERHGGRAIHWQHFIGILTTEDIVISSVQSDRHILLREAVEKSMIDRDHRPLFLIDLGLPRNIDPETREVYNVFLYNLDDLQSAADSNKEERRKDLPKAERIIEEEVEKFLRWQARLHLEPVVKRLRHKIDHIRQSELDDHLRKLDRLTDRERRIITALSHAIVNKILHEPTVRLKSSLDEQTLQTVRRLFDLDGEE